MRARLAVADLSNRPRRSRLRATWRVGSEPQTLARTRALRETTMVRRALRGAKSASNGVVGLSATLDALSRGAVATLLVTRRFAERYPVAAANMAFLAATSSADRTRVTGTAELELDLIAGGVAAVLRHSAAA